MVTNNRWAILLLAAVVAAATSSAASDRHFVCPPGSGASRLEDVTAALKPAREAQKTRLADIEAITDSAEAERRTEAATDAYFNDRWVALSALAEAGNAEAMARLSADVRDSDDPATIRVWFALTQCAAERGNAFANDELARFWWHQEGDGSLADIQTNRRLAMDYAGRSAALGDIGALNRIGVYVAGNVHQYPAALPLAARVAELCARADSAGCQSAIVGRKPYDYGQSSAENAFWLGRLAEREPARFTRQRDEAWSKLSPADLDALRVRLSTFHPLTWGEAAPQWEKLKLDILAGGAGSVGAPSSCTTATPWCFGRALSSISVGKPTR